MNVCISIPEGIRRPDKDSIKHVEFNGEDERKYSFAYKKLENTLFFKYLESKESFSLHEKIMAVTFNTSMQEEANIKLCKDILKKGIFCDGKIFHFLGHSSSQLREKTCFMMQGSNQEIQFHLKNFGEKSDANIRAKKIGLLFSPFHYCVEVNEDPCERLRFIDLDGPQLMSREFAAKVRAVMNVNYPEPSALLIHYQGFQRILLSRTKQVSVNSPQIEFDESTWPVANLQEVSRNYASNLAYILDYSRPRQHAHLDAKLFMLLAARGVQVEHLKALQTDYYILLENMCNDSASKEYFLRLTGRTIEGSQTHVDIETIRREEVRSMVERNRSGTEVPRVRVLVPKARVVFGVQGPFEDLKIDECYFKPTLPHEDRMEFEAEKKIFVVRIPCYYPGDIRVFKLCHEKTAYQHLNDCLVLPKNAGADLSGNQFIVCWDAKLIPKQNVKPCSYSPTLGETMYDTWNRLRSFWCGGSREKDTKEVREELIDHFASFKDDLPSRIDQVYLDLARRDSGLSFPECEELSRMYYQATNHTVDKEYLWNRLEEFELRLSEGREEQQGEEDGEDATEEEGRNASLETPLIYITCQFRVGGKMLGYFERAASAFVQKAKRNHFFD